MAKSRRVAEKPEVEVKPVRSRGLFLVMACYVLVSAFNIGFAASSSFRLVYLVVLGALGLLATYGLFKLKRFGLWLGVSVSILSITVGIVTLYASVMISGGDLVLLNVILLGYTALNIITLLYLCVKRKIFS
ncbi:hypothetical protein KEJ26_06185 [Candidatus Bathyarchaeota archaeon]|nr:hypothetical protein [Candidatus Bathyarchaeota archaeon]